MEVLDLKACREARGLSLDHVYGITKISVPLLVAIEESDFSSLPPPVYSRKFIAAYAEYLGQPSAPVLAKYEQYLKTVPPSLFHPVHVPMADIGKTHLLPRRRANRLVKGFLLAGVATALVLALIVPDLRNNFFMEATTLRDPVVSPPDMAKPAADDRRETRPNRPAAGPQKTAADSAIVERQHLIVEARELTWLRIRTDNDPPHQLLMNPGERIERFADRHFVIDIGNAGGVELHLQGQNLGQLGKSGEVVRLSLP